ncbi:hypothetical protein HF086_003197, partial [Spodoptera exigua]
DISYYRLPRSIEPQNYKLSLLPNMTSNFFAGSVLITIAVKENVKTITLHANNLTIHGVTLTTNKSQDIPVFSTNKSLDKRELLMIHFKRELEIMQYKLFINFSGRLDNKLVGFYESRLKSSGTMVASKFQPTYARQAFPCFDEPDFKATYDITLWKPPSYIALSNMNVSILLILPNMIGIPDYVSGATEHWGLITYRETSFLVDKATASAANKISVANTIAHELAHMWFGNLDKKYYYRWLLDNFLTKVLHPVLSIDAKLSSHPIVQTVATPDQITSIFDSISYNKGASILRMLEGFIGPENFRQGVSDYLKKYEFGNTVTQELLSSLEPYFKRDFPDLNLTYKWFVPITFKTDTTTKNEVTWLADTAQDVKLKTNPDDKWLKININQVGYYRVNYDVPTWQALIEALKSKTQQLSGADRSHLLDDVFALAEARAVPYSIALELTTYLQVEDELTPWQSAGSVFGALEDRLQYSLVYDNLMKYIQRIIRPIYAKQNWDAVNLPVLDSLLRTKILSLAVHYQLPEAVEKAKIKAVALFVGMKSASMADWDKLWAIYKKEEDVQELLKLRRALAAPRDTTILRNRYLGNIIPAITASFNTDLKLKEMESFFGLYPEAGAGETGRRRALETVKNNIRWSTYHLKQVTTWIDANYQS